MDNEVDNTPAVLTPTPASQWKGRLKVDGSPIELPSGNVALVKQISPMAFMESGLIPDPLRPIIHKSIHDKKGLRPADQKKMIDDPKLLASAMELMDRTIVHVVIEPEITMPPKCRVCGEYANTPRHDKIQPSFEHAYNEDERKPGLLYADEVDMLDKQFVFQWVMGGSKALQPFREQIEQSLGSVPDGEDVQDEAI